MRYIKSVYGFLQALVQSHQIISSLMAATEIVRQKADSDML